MIILVIACILLCFIISWLINRRYEHFVLEHSIAIKNLNEINQAYSFKKIPSFDMKNAYDNEHFYNSISPEDYLIYQLVYISKDVFQAIKDTNENKSLFIKYKETVKSSCKLGEYDTTELPKSERKLSKTEKRIFDSLKNNPTIELKISVYLRLTKINGAFITSKTDVFNEDEIREFINRIKHKNGDFYLDEEIWQAICRVERGKVTNKIRFAIYERDGYRCRKCGRSDAFANLEIDHIFPISKGGKSTFDNLQTLCHKCNSLKSNTVERGAVNPRTKRYGETPLCPNCNVNLVVRKGTYGDFYGCPNYPNCKHTQQIK